MDSRKDDINLYNKSRTICLDQDLDFDVITYPVPYSTDGWILQANGFEYQWAAWPCLSEKYWKTNIIENVAFWGICVAQKNRILKWCGHTDQQSSTLEFWKGISSKVLYFSLLVKNKESRKKWIFISLFYINQNCNCPSNFFFFFETAIVSYNANIWIFIFESHCWYTTKVFCFKTRSKFILFSFFFRSCRFLPR